MCFAFIEINSVKRNDSSHSSSFKSRIAWKYELLSAFLSPTSVCWKNQLLSQQPLDAKETDTKSGAIDAKSRTFNLQPGDKWRLEDSSFVLYLAIKRYLNCAGTEAL